MTLTVRDRFRGAMVGTLCGDALGAPYEWSWTPEEIEADIRQRGGLVPHEYEPFDYIEPWKKKRLVLKGHPTDDSELAAALAKSIVEKGCLDQENLYYHLRDFIHGNTVEGRRSILTDVAYGTGSTLSAALKPERYEVSLENFAAGSVPTPPSNGALMRSIAVPLYCLGKPFERLMRVAQQQSMVTHRNPESIASCMIFALYATLLLHGVPPLEAWSKSKNIFVKLRDVDIDTSRTVLAIEPTKPDFKTDVEPIKGYVVLSLRIALWASIESKDFADGILRSISVAGDTDTYAAIAGGLLGAQYGIQGIPQRWLDVLQGREIMIDLADKLYDIARS